MDDEPNPNRRALLGLAASLPIIGGIAEMLFKIERHHPEREIARLPVRAALDPLGERQLPIMEAATAAISDDRERDQN